MLGKAWEDMRRVCTLHNCSSACNPNTQSRIGSSCDMMTVLWQFVPVFRVEPQLCPKLGVTWGGMWTIAAGTKACDPIGVDRRAEGRLMSAHEIEQAREGCSSLCRFTNRRSIQSTSRHDRVCPCAGSGTPGTEVRGRPQVLSNVF
jgi:hypothetical protein